MFVYLYVCLYTRTFHLSYGLILFWRGRPKSEVRNSLYRCEKCKKPYWQYWICAILQQGCYSCYTNMQCSLFPNTLSVIMQILSESGRQLFRVCFDLLLLQEFLLSIYIRVHLVLRFAVPPTVFHTNTDASDQFNASAAAVRAETACVSSHPRSLCHRRLPGLRGTTRTLNITTKTKPTKPISRPA